MCEYGNFMADGFFSPMDLIPPDQNRPLEKGAVSGPAAIITSGENEAKLANVYKLSVQAEVATAQRGGGPEAR